MGGRESAPGDGSGRRDAGRIGGSRLRAEEGQSTVEWTGLILIVALAMTIVGSLAGLGLPGAAIARGIADKIICVVDGAEDCGATVSELAMEYGPEIAAAIQEHAPDLLYEESMREVPVDYRECREDACALAEREAGAVSRSATGLPATVFVRVIDCRPQPEIPPGEDVNCSDEREGQLYIQYWLYFPDSQTEPFGDRGYHRDDWESFQVRIGEPATLARASSHHSYNYDGGPDNWLSDVGINKKSGWGLYGSTYHLSAGSHAGHVEGDHEEPLWTPGDDLMLIPLEPIAAGGPGVEFAVTPPWLKDVWRDPESEETG